MIRGRRLTLSLRRRSENVVVVASVVGNRLGSTDAVECVEASCSCMHSTSPRVARNTGSVYPVACSSSIAITVETGPVQSGTWPLQRRRLAHRLLYHCTSMCRSRVESFYATNDRVALTTCTRSIQTFLPFRLPFLCREGRRVFSTIILQF